MRPARDHLAWPFFDASHRALAARFDEFADEPALAGLDHRDADATCRRVAAALGAAGLLGACVADPDGDARSISSRALCLARETLAHRDGLADFAFAMQGLGTGAIALAGAPDLRRAILPKARAGEWLAAFALSEDEAGSDVAAMRMTARREGGHFVLDGEKTWISNGGIAALYTVFARTGEAPGARGLSAFVVLADDPGFSIVERIETMAPHPMARIRFESCRVPASRLLGAPGEGFALAMRTLDIFRASVGAAALGLARRALDEALAHARTRKMFGGTLADLQMTQAAIGDMATGIDAAALLVARAAWTRDALGAPTTREAAMAKLAATETAQRVIDRALQMFGGRGVRVGETVERLYRDIRALRIYEGASEVQRIVIARDLMRNRGGAS